MPSQTFSVPGAPEPSAQYAPAVRRGQLVAVSGQVPFLPGRIDGPPPGFREQAEAVFSYLQQLLEAAGASVSDVITVRIYLAREEDFPVMNEIFDKVFGEVCPARTTIWVHLPGGLLIEADALAVIGE